MSALVVQGKVTLVSSKIFVIFGITTVKRMLMITVPIPSMAAA